MTLTYVGDFPLTSVQKSFTPNSDEIHELSIEDGNYLLNTFPKLFFFFFYKKETPKVETKEEVKVEAPAESTAKKPTKK